MTRCTLACLLVAASCGGSAGDPDAPPPGPDAAPTSVFDDTRTLAPDDIAEGGWSAGAGDRILVRITGTGPFAWNIHGHGDSGETTTIAEGVDATAVDQIFTAPEAATWNLLVANYGTAAVEIVVRLEMYDGASWNGWDL